MKKYIIYTIIACMSLTSCSKWLTIDPSDQVSEKDLYSDADGFYNQLNGIYKQMATSEMYGREMTWGLVDVLAQYYNTKYTSNYGYKEAVNYNYGYDRTKTMIEPIWSTGFNIIANCNDLIRATETADSMFFTRREMERQMILGEAYAVRALLHFDLLRLFAPAPMLNDKGKYIPYLKSFPIHIPIKESTEVVLENVVEDLKKAEKLTFKLDSVSLQINKNVQYRLEHQTGGYERYTMHRGYRMNYYAIKALLARVYLYKGDKTNAYKYARNVMLFRRNDDMYQFTTEDRAKLGNVKLYDDVMFALFNNNLMDYSKDVTQSEATSLVLFDFDDMFNYEHKKDLRALYQWKYNSNTGQYEPLKIKEQSSGLGLFSNKMIPMIRFSEMYYILAECAFENDPEEAASYIEDMRYYRGNKDYEIDESDSQTKFNETVLLNDFKREFYGEGQLFFFYKRLNMKAQTSWGDVKEVGKGFVLPIPDSDDIN